LGLNYDERVMVSIVNEVLKSVVAQVLCSILVQCDLIDESKRSNFDKDQITVRSEGPELLHRN